MTNKLVNFFKQPTTQVTILILGLFLSLSLYFNPDFVVPLTTNSFFGLFGIGISLAIMTFLVGMFLIIVPEISTTITGIILVVISIIIGSSSIFGAITELFSFINLGPLGIYIIGALFIWLLYKRFSIRLLRQYPQIIKGGINGFKKWGYFI